jgi:hypothetical protein
MWKWPKTRGKGCEEFLAAVDANVSCESMSVALRGHAESCGDCRDASKDHYASRQLLQVLTASEQTPRPWFAARVMAEIAARESGLTRTLDVWSFVPKLAARVSGVSLIALLLATTWMYGRSVSSARSGSAATDLSGEPIVDHSTMVSTDDVLANLTERGQ